MEKYFFYVSNQGRGYAYPIVKNGEGNFMIYDRKSKRPLPQATKELLHDLLIYEKSQMEQFEGRLIEVKVDSLDDLCVWLDKYDKAVLEKKAAEEALFTASCHLKKLLREDTNMYPSPISYAETKSMGCTDIVYWKSEPQTNPKTGNEFFTPEDAKILFAKLKEEHAKEIEEEINVIKSKHNISENDDEFDAEEYWKTDNYIWQDAANLDDLIQEEENHADWVCHP